MCLKTVVQASHCFFLRWRRQDFDKQTLIRFFSRWKHRNTSKTCKAFDSWCSKLHQG